MNLPSRLSARVVNESETHLVDTSSHSVSGAECSHPLGASQLSGGQASHGTAVSASGRVSSRQLARLRARLSDRDTAVLGSLSALHYLTTRQLERLHFHVPGVTPRSAARSARRRLAKLHEAGLVDRLKRRVGGVRAGSASYVLTLSSLGARVLKLSTRRRFREPGTKHLAHVLAVAELVVQLHEHCRTHDVDLLAVEAEPECWRPYVGLHGARVLLKPDLRVTLGTGQHELHWFVELDRGSEHRPTLTRKVTSYVNAWRDGGEEARAGVFPAVLWVVPDQRRAEVITEVCDSTPGVPEGMFATAVTERAVEVLTSRPDEASAGGAS